MTAKRHKGRKIVRPEFQNIKNRLDQYLFGLNDRGYMTTETSLLAIKALQPLVLTYRAFLVDSRHSMETDPRLATEYLQKLGAANHHDHVAWMTPGDDSENLGGVSEIISIEIPGQKLVTDSAEIELLKGIAFLTRSW